MARQTERPADDIVESAPRSRLASRDLGARHRVARQLADVLAHPTPGFEFVERATELERASRQRHEQPACRSRRPVQAPPSSVARPHRPPGHGQEARSTPTHAPPGGPGRLGRSGRGIRRRHPRGTGARRRPGSARSALPRRPAASAPQCAARKSAAFPSGRSERGPPAAAVGRPDASADGALAPKLGRGPLERRVEVEIGTLPEAVAAPVATPEHDGLLFQNLQRGLDLRRVDIVERGAQATPDRRARRCRHRTTTATRCT